MLSFARIPQALQLNEAIDVHNSESKGVASVTALTIGADIETGRAANNPRTNDALQPIRPLGGAVNPRSFMLKIADNGKTRSLIQIAMEVCVLGDSRA